jgi:hypothetical protein
MWSPALLLLLAPPPSPRTALVPQVVLAVIMMQVMGEAAAALPPRRAAAAAASRHGPLGAAPGRRWQPFSLQNHLCCAWHACSVAVSTVYYFSTFRAVYLRHVDTTRRPAFTTCVVLPPLAGTVCREGPPALAAV